MHRDRKYLFQSNFISFAFVYGHFHEHFLVVEFVPERTIVEEKARKMEIEKNWEEMYIDERIVQVV